MATFTVDQVTYALRKEGIPEKLLETLAGKRSPTARCSFIACFCFFFVCLFCTLKTYSCCVFVSVIEAYSQHGT